jgi:outer membrane protein OmpA-like peptidoglycan-associated protein
MQFSIFNTMRRYIRIGILLSLTVWSGTSLATDCQLAADYYNRAKAETSPQRIIQLLNQSAQLCSNFNAWYMLGLIYARQGQTSQAIDAYIQAETEAASIRTEALALARRGELLRQDGQVLAALKVLELASRFHPEPAPKWLETSLKSTRIRACHTIIPAAEIARVFKTGTRVSMDGRFAVKPAVNLPIHFAFDRASLNRAGSIQVMELGSALTRIKSNQASFLLVGHTDKRGSKSYNQALSEKRAQTVKLELERHFPALEGKMKTSGRGESELLYDGNTESDHMLNRRVKVTIYE